MKPIYLRAMRSRLALSVAAGLLSGAAAQAQITTIPKEGLPGLSKEAQSFEIEHNYRRENNLGLTVPAEPGTPPGSTDPKNIEGIWEIGRTYTINADGSFTLSGTRPPGAAAAGAGGAGGPSGAGGPPPGGAAGGPPGGGAGGPPPGGAPGGAGPGGGGAQQQCVPSAPFTVGQPGRIVQTKDAIYIFRNGDATSYRRIQMGGTHPANFTPTYSGHSIGHWEGDTLIVETVGLKSGGGGGGGPGGVPLRFDSDSKVVERIKKIEGHMTLEDIITVYDKSGKETAKTRLTSYYRPDLQYVEAPCEDYSDPFEGQYNQATGDSASRGGATATKK